MAISATSRWSFLLPAAGLALTAGLLGGLLLPPGRAPASPDPTPTPRRVYLPIVLKDCGPGCGSGRVEAVEVEVWDEGWGKTFVGLVANGLSEAVSGVRAVIELRDAGGGLVETLTADAAAWLLRPGERTCFRAVSFSSWTTYTVRVAYAPASPSAWPDVRVESLSLSASGWPTASGSVRNASGVPAYDPQVAVWLRDGGRLADCVSDILSPNPLPGGGTASFSLPASRVLSGSAALGGSHASGRPAP
jgi:hypothetical protein